MRQVHVITDLQFGSTGKGLFAGYMAKRLRPDCLVTAWGPNAGHTYIDREGNKHVNIMIASGVVSQSVKRILIGPGSLIDPDRLLDEMTRYGLVDNSHVQVAIHEAAAVVQSRHREAEGAYGFQIGSTMKGVGAALMEKIKREPQSKGMFTIIAGHVLRGTPLEGYLVGASDYNDLLDKSEVVMLEGAQGFSLSINQGFYPYTTSRDCTTAQLMSDCGIPCQRGWSDVTVYGVARTFPIRVSNRYSGGQMIGTSGPCYADQREIDWKDLGVEPELTTVTKLPRRVFTFSEEQIRQAVRMNGADYVFLNFCNYLKEPFVREPDEALEAIVVKIQAAGAVVRWTGWGPKESDIQQVKKEI